MKRYACAISFAATVFLSGCDLGDGSSSDEARTAVSGRAVKGVLQHALVSAYSWQGGEWVWVETTTTDGEGDFRFSAPFPSAAVKLVVEPAADGSSRMTCDAASGCGWAGLDAGDVNRNGSFDFGELMPLDPSFTLATILPSRRKAAPVAITPMTHLVAGLAERMPGGVTPDNLALSQARVADLFGLEENFASRRPVDPADSGEVGEAADTDLRHALVNAAFAELAGGGAVADVLDLGVSSLAAYGGQLPRVALERTAGAAASVLTALSLDPARDAALRDHLAGLDNRWAGSFSESTAGPSPSVGAQLKAGLFLRSLDEYTSRLGADEAGSFMMRHAERLGWVSTRQLPVLPQLIPSLGVIALQAAVVASIPSLQTSSQILVNAPEGLEAVYDPGTATLSIRGTHLGHAVDVMVEVLPFTEGFRSGRQRFRLLPGSTLASGFARTTLEITVDVDYLDTPVIALADAIEAQDQVAMDAALAAVREQLQLSLQWSGRLYLEDSLDSSRVVTGTVGGQIEVDVPAGDRGEPVLKASIDELYLSSPFGDEISNQTGLPALELVVGQEDQFEARLDISLFDMPRARVTVSGASGLSGAVARTLSSANPAVAPELEAQIVLADSGDVWSLSIHEGGAVEVTSRSSLLPNVRLLFPGSGAGYLYAGDDFAGTVTMDPANVGLIIHGADGIVRRRYAQPEVLRQDPWTPWSDIGLY